MLHGMVRAGWVIAAWIGVAAAAAAAPDELSAAIAQCRAEANDTARLACYDQQADRLGAQPADASPSPAGSSGPAGDPSATPPGTDDSAARSAGRQPGTTDVEKFGERRGALARQETARKLEEAQNQPDPQLVATVTQVSTRSGGQLLIVLDNGQVWTQKKADPKFGVEVGDQVRIEPGLLGSFMMWTANSRRTTRVTRLR